MKPPLWIAGLAWLAIVMPARSTEPPAFSVSIQVDAAKPGDDLKPIYRFFGADEPNYATMRDGRKLLRQIGEVGTAQAYFRAHNLLVTGDGTPAFKWGSTNAYTEDADGRPVYDWTVLDRIFDAYRSNAVEPYVEIGFMPKALSVHPEPYQQDWSPRISGRQLFTGWAYPPKSYDKWRDLVSAWVAHCVSRYGAAEVERWYWEVWNEANIGYWQGTPEEFIKLHDYAIDGVRRALPNARVGGPDFAGDGGETMGAFLEHCLRGKNFATGGTGTPLDFLSFHAKGAPSLADGHIRMGIAAQLRTVDNAFARFARYPELKGKPIIIGEADPDSCAACQGAQFGYRNLSLYASYTAEALAREEMLAEKHGVDLEGSLTWAFEFENQPFFPGYRALASNGLPLPVFNLFRMLGKMTGQRLPAESSADPGLAAIVASGVRGRPDVSALASIDSAQRRMAILVWHYHDDNVPGPVASVGLTITGLSPTIARARVTHYRIDDEHSNVYSAWQRLGSPATVTQEQYATLEAASELAALNSTPTSVQANAGVIRLDFPLPREAVSLVLLDW